MGHVSVAGLLDKMLTENWNIFDPDKSILFSGQFECLIGLMRTSCFSGMLCMWQLKFGVNKARFSGQFSGQNTHWKLKYIWSRQIHSCHWSTWVSYWEDEELNYGWNYSFQVKPRPPRSFRRGKLSWGLKPYPVSLMGCVWAKTPLFALFLCLKPNQGPEGEFEPCFVLPRESEWSSALIHHA